MQKLVTLMLAFGLFVGMLAPSGKPKAPVATASHTNGGLFERPPYKETKLRRRSNGHFYVTAEVNGTPITFLVDTGASTVALSETDARAAGLPFTRHEFEPIGRTANGIARGKALMLSKVAIEGKEVMEVEAAIIEGAELSLLGQSYLARIAGVQMNGDTMVLR